MLCIGYFIILFSYSNHGKQRRETKRVAFFQDIQAFQEFERRKRIQRKRRAARRKARATNGPRPQRQTISEVSEVPQRERKSEKPPFIYVDPVGDFNVKLCPSINPDLQRSQAETRNSHVNKFDSSAPKTGSAGAAKSVSSFSKKKNVSQMFSSQEN